MQPFYKFHLLAFLTLWNISILYARASMYPSNDESFTQSSSSSISSSSSSSSHRSWEKTPSTNLKDLEEQWLLDDWDEDDIPIDEHIYMESNQRRKEAMKELDHLMGGRDVDNINDETNGGGRGRGRGRSGIDDRLVQAAREAEISGKASMIFVKLEKGFMFSKLDAKGRRRDGSNGDATSSEGDGLDDDITSHVKMGLPVMSWDDLAKICNEWQVDLSWAVIESSCFPVEPDSLLFTTKRGWEGEDVWKYLSTKKEIEEATWNDRTMYPFEFLQDEFD